MTLSLILLFILLENIFISHMVRTGTQYRLQGYIVVHMALIMLLAPKLMTIFGLTSNIGNLLYATIFPVQAIIFYKYGLKEAIKVMNMTTFKMAVIFVFSYMIGFFPIIPGNEVLGGAVNTITHHSARVVMASFLAFYISQFVFLKVLFFFKNRGITRDYLFAVIPAQITDSLIFFPVAFSDLSFTTTIGIMISGFIIKLSVAPLFVPLFLLNKGHLKDIDNLK